VSSERGVFLSQRLKGTMSGNECNFNNSETRAVIKFFSLHGKVPKEIHTVLRETLGEHAPSFGNVKNWVAQFKCGDIPPVMCLVLDDPKQLPNRRLLIKFTS
jgi:hypothetical protein